jgi:hypothetical protein
MRYYLIIIAVFICSSLFSQKSNNRLKESYIDSLSYVYSMKNEHVKLYELYQLAKKEQICFYYLEFRVGISFFNQFNYAQSKKHFLNALEYYPSDLVSKEYLFYSYLYLGEINYARDLVSHFKIERQESFFKLLPKKKSLAIESGIQASKYKNELNSLGNPKDIYLEANRNKSIVYNQVGISLPVFSKATYYGGFSQVINSRELNYFTQRDMYVYNYNLSLFDHSITKTQKSFDYNLIQNQFYSGLTLPFISKTTLQVGGNYIRYKQSKTEAMKDSSFSVNLDTLNYYYSFPVSTTTSNNFVVNFSLSRSFNKVTPQFSYSYSSISSKSINQFTLQAHYLPKGNITKSYCIGLGILGENSKQKVFFLKHNRKITNVLWLESYLYGGDLTNFNEGNAYVVYNIADKIRFKAGINLTYFWNERLNFSIRYDYLNRESNYSRYTMQTIENVSDISNTNSLILNLLWKF